MQKKILSAVLALFLVGSASSAFAGGYWGGPSVDIDIDDSFNTSNRTTNIDKTYDNDVFDVTNDDGAVLNQYSKQTPGYGHGQSYRGGHGYGQGMPTQVMSGNVASQVNNVTGDVSSIAIGNNFSPENSYNSTRNETDIDVDLDVDIDDSFNTANDSFNRLGRRHHGRNY